MGLVVLGPVERSLFWICSFVYFSIFFNFFHTGEYDGEVRLEIPVTYEYCKAQGLPRAL